MSLNINCVNIILFCKHPNSNKIFNQIKATVVLDNTLELFFNKQLKESQALLKALTPTLLANASLGKTVTAFSRAHLL